MARVATISDEQLLAAARALFLMKGVSATTAEIAVRAGVSEGTLFKRFGSKDRLFERAMQAETDFEGLLALPSIGAPGGTARELLVEVGELLLERFARIIPFALMHMAGAMSNDRLPLFELGRPPPLIALDALERLFRKLASDGRISREARPEVLARVFLGSIWHFAFLAYVITRFAKISAHPMSPREFVEAQADLLLAGVSAQPAKPKPRATKPRVAPSTKLPRKGRSS